MPRSFVVGMFLSLTVVVGSAEAPITDLERQRLVAHMEMTASWLEDEVRGLSTAQATFGPLELLDHPRGARPSRGGRAYLLEGSAERQEGLRRTSWNDERCRRALVRHRPDQSRNSPRNGGAITQTAGCPERPQLVSHPTRTIASVHSNDNG